ncbi:MAG: hypothetical protein NVS4B8_21140 [Herpetosiphon sp.]
MADAYSDPYQVLGLARAATPVEIKQAYIAQVRLHPPERDPEIFKQIRAAYERLRDPAVRSETDMLLLTPLPVPARKRRIPKLDLTVHREDVIAAARAMTDLARSDWRDQYRKIKL